MCVLVYQTRSMVFKKWNKGGGEAYDQVYELYNHDPVFIRMINQVRTKLFNLFIYSRLLRKLKYFDFA